MKPIVIAGNGPSLATIDYSRLPQDFDVFRCNQFYFEEKYFLGKNIKGVFFNPGIFKEQFFTLHHLEVNKEYFVQDVYCNFFGKKDDRVLDEIKYFFPNVRMASDYLALLPQLHAILMFYELYYNKRFTSGIIMLLVAIAQGYKEIYLTGIDFYEGGGADYAFKMDNKMNINSIVPAFTKKNFKDVVHDKSVDIHAIKSALELPDIKIYCLSQDITLAKILPLAPKQNHQPMQIISKPANAICDLVPLHGKTFQKKSLLKKTLKSYGLNGENFYIKAFLDLKIIIEALIKIIFFRR